MKVSAYQSLNGVLHRTELDQLLADRRFEIQAIFNDRKEMWGSPSWTEVVRTVVLKEDKITEVFRKYRQKIKGAKERQQQENQVVMTKINR